MDGMMLHDLLDKADIRKELHSGEWYYSTLDVIAFFYKSDRKTAQNRYHVLKKRLGKNNQTIPSLLKIKAISADNKNYFTDFTTIVGIQMLQNYLEPTLRNRQHRLDKRKDDEVIHFHPKVIRYLESLGWEVEHHVRLPSGSVIDLVATAENTTCIIECKPSLTKNHLYLAAGQILCYCAEYKKNSRPVVASYSDTVTNYGRQMCRKLRIDVLEIDRKSEVGVSVAWAQNQ